MQLSWRHRSPCVAELLVGIREWGEERKEKKGKTTKGVVLQEHQKSRTGRIPTLDQKVLHNPMKDSVVVVAEAASNQAGEGERKRTVR